MIFGQDRSELRQMYADAWAKRCDNSPMSPLEAQIADVIAMHPEYQGGLARGELDDEYTPDGGKTNPFLHMGLHLGVREQLATNRPPGIRELYKKVAARAGDAHAAEHQVIECLAETLWEAQSANRLPDEQKYLERLQRLTGRKV